MTQARICDGCKKPIETGVAGLQVVPFTGFGKAGDALDFHGKDCIQSWLTPGRKKSLGGQLLGAIFPEAKK